MNLSPTFSLRKLRLYGLAVVIYVAIASIIVIPKIEHARVANQVSNQLSQYLSSAKSHSAVTSSAPISGAPTSIAINRLNINLPVAPGFYNFATNKWTLDSKHVFTDNLTNPNPIISTDQTNTLFIYGHDIPGVLVDTSNLVYGDILTINTSNGYQFRYYYDHDKKVAPTDSSILNEKNTGDPIMLVTCTGEFYQFRHVMYFHLIDVTKLSAPTSYVQGQPA